MKWIIIIGIIWILGMLFFLSLFKAAARGDKMLEEIIEDDNEKNQDNIV
ncbi:MAG: hypothetical protein ACRCTZ_07200 [Sarcina sp.]